MFREGAMEPQFQVQLKIRRPVSQVFDAVVDPKKLTGYFVKTSSGPLAEGVTVKWKFAEVPQPVDVLVHEVLEDERIVFEWQAEGGARTRVVMMFQPLGDQDTMVQISESGWRSDPESIKASYGNAGGWMHMMCCMEGYLEYGINLRADGAL
jgi:uncharacterized protein YndB with AHSA1/START domain